MYKLRSKHIFKTRNPNLVISAIQFFPNINNTVEKMVAVNNTVALRNDPMLLHITAIYTQFNHGEEFVPIHFIDTCPKLEKFQKYITTKSMFACIGYRYTGYPLSHEKSPIIVPTYLEYKKYLSYLCDSSDELMWKWFFVECVKQYIYEKTKHLSEELRHRRFYVIENKKMPIIWSNNFSKKDSLDFIDNMHNRNIYELMFTEFSN